MCLQHKMLLSACCIRNPNFHPNTCKFDFPNSSKNDLAGQRTVDFKSGQLKFINAGPSDQLKLNPISHSFKKYIDIQSL